MATSSPSCNRPLLTVLIVAALLAGLCLVAIRLVIRYEERLGRQHWQTSLDRLADAKTNAIQAWLHSQMAVLGQLQANPSLQFYVQQLQTRGGHGQTEAAELTFISNLVLATAERHGFVSSQASADIRANLPLAADNGLGVFSPDLRPLVATPGFAYPVDNLAAKVREVLASGQGTILEVLDWQGRTLIGFLAPLRQLPGAPAATAAPALLLGYRDFGASMGPLLRSRDNEATNAWLVRQEGELVTYLSRSDDAPGLVRHTPASSIQAAAQACAHPGRFSEGPDHSGSSVLFTSRAIPATSFVLVQPVGTKTALGEYRQRERHATITLILVTCLAGACLFAAWRHGASLREHAHAEELRRQTELLQGKTHLLTAITDHISEMILLVGPRMQCLYANPPLLRHLDAESDSLQGKHLSSIFGLVPARLLTSAITAAQGKQTPEEATLILDLGNRPRPCHAIFTPLAPAAETLVTLHDLTELSAAQERESLLFQHLVKAIMRAIDLHDPYSANHSAKTASLAMAMGRFMGLGQEELTTLETAANLCNLGKLSIPREILTKQGDLNEAERQQIRQESHHAAALLGDLDFPGPLQQTLLQKHELLDGSGPNHMHGEEIIVTARVLAVATAFVAMISPRAYRERLERTTALDQLMAGADNKYDRRALAALFQVVENEPGWWAEER